MKAHTKRQSEGESSLIVCDEHKFVFVHIPKCAGTSIRKSLESRCRFDPRFIGVEEHPELGKLDVTHIPLSILRKYFAETYQKVRTYDSFAVVRDPCERFPSSLFQRLKMYGEKPVETMSRKEFAQAVDATIARLANHSADEVLPYDYIHFQEQKTYVVDQGVQVVETLFPLESVSELFEHVGRIIGGVEGAEGTTGNSHENRSEHFKTDFIGNIAAPLLPLYSRSIKQWLPRGFRNLLSRMFLVDQNTKFRDVFESTHVRQFVNEFYAEDFALFDQVMSQRAAAKD